MVPFTKGFLVGGQDCTVLVYEKHEGDLRNPYILKPDKKIQNIRYKYPVCSMVLS